MWAHHSESRGACALRARYASNHGHLILLPSTEASRVRPQYSTSTPGSVVGRCNYSSKTAQKNELVRITQIFLRPTSSIALHPHRNSQAKRTRSRILTASHLEKSPNIRSIASRNFCPGIAPPHSTPALLNPLRTTQCPLKNMRTLSGYSLKVKRGTSTFNYPQFWGEFDWLLMDRILPQARYLRCEDDAWRSDCHEETATGSRCAMPGVVCGFPGGRMDRQ